MKTSFKKLFEFAEEPFCERCNFIIALYQKSEDSAQNASASYANRAIRLSAKWAYRRHRIQLF